MEASKLVIALCGAPGSGKSALSDAIVQAWSQQQDAAGNAISVTQMDIDRYQTYTDQPIENIQQGESSNINYNAFNIPQLPEHLESLKEGHSIQIPGDQAPIVAAGPIVFETHFGREHHATGQHIDFLIWIDTPLDLALSRKLQVFCQEFLDDKEHHHEQITWMKDYLEIYEKSVRPTLEEQAKRIAPTADLVLDGCLSIEELSKLVVEACSEIGVEG